MNLHIHRYKKIYNESGQILRPGSTEPIQFIKF